MVPPFASRKSFLDPLLTSDGKPYAKEGLNSLIRDCYLISKNCYTSYKDVLDITPRERNALLSLIAEDIKKNVDYVKNSVTTK